MNVNQSVGNSSFQPFLNTNKKSEEKSEKSLDGLFSSMIELSVSEEKVSKIKGKQQSDSKESKENPLELPLDLLSHFDGNIKKLLKSDIVKEIKNNLETKPVVKSDQELLNIAKKVNTTSITSENSSKSIKVRTSDEINTTVKYGSEKLENVNQLLEFKIDNKEELQNEHKLISKTDFITKYDKKATLKNNLENLKPIDFIKAQKIDIEKSLRPIKKVSLDEHPKTKIIRESTDQLLSEHKRFINNLKQKAGIEVEVENTTNTKQEAPKSEIQKFHRSFFDGLINEIHKNKIVKTKESDSDSKGGEVINSSILGGGELNTENNKSQIQNGSKTIEPKLSIVENSKVDVEIGESQIENKHAKKSNQSQETRVFDRIKANEFVSKTSQNVRSLAPNGQATARFHLTPETLGKVFVEINVKSNIATLNIKADNKEVVKLIEKQIGNLMDKLQLSGIQTETVNVSQSDFENASGSKEGNQGQKNQEREAREEYLESLKTLKRLKDSNEKRILHGGNNA